MKVIRLFIIGLQLSLITAELFVHKTFYFQRRLESSNPLSERKGWKESRLSAQHHETKILEKRILQLNSIAYNDFEREILSMANEDIPIDKFLKRLGKANEKIALIISKTIKKDLSLLQELQPEIVTSLVDVRICHISPTENNKIFFVFRNDFVLQIIDEKIIKTSYETFRKNNPKCLQTFPESLYDQRELKKMTLLNMNSQEPNVNYKELRNRLQPPSMAVSILKEKSNDWGIAPKIKALLEVIVNSEDGWQSEMLGKNIFFGVKDIPLLSYKRSNDVKHKLRAMKDQVMYQLAIQSHFDKFIVPYMYVQESSASFSGSLSIFSSLFPIDHKNGLEIPLPSKYALVGSILYLRTETGNTYCSLTQLQGLTAKYIPSHSTDEAYIINQIYYEFVGAEELDQLALYSILFRTNGFHSRNFVLTYSPDEKRFILKNIDYELALGSFHHTISMETYGYRPDDNILPLHPHFARPLGFQLDGEFRYTSIPKRIFNLLRKVPYLRKNSIAYELKALFNIKVEACKNILHGIYHEIHETARMHMDNLEMIINKMGEYISDYHSDSILSLTEKILRDLRMSKAIILGPEEI